MPDYDFRSLSTFDFEILARDLLQEELKVRLESFAKGRDGGVDFRFRNAMGDLIVQCKHYASFDELLRVITRHEADKVRRLRPKRYILAVSTPLTPQRKESLLALLAPYCRASGDIYGREDLNNLLGIYSTIERKNFKLWLTSEAVLTRVLQAGIWGDADLTLERIRRRTSRYVPNPSLDRAKQILDKHHYCIIAGIPGIGKTTLAEILLVDYVDRHGFQAIRIANDLSEIKDAKRPEQRQIFYFDDFLGTKALDKLEKNEDRRLIEFIEEVGRNKIWRFVLTTREYILNAAKLRYESFAYPAVPLTPCIVELSDYTRPIRGKILYNHIFFSDLTDPYKRALLENRHYEEILSHQNYNPRIVDHMTQARNVEGVGAEKYFDDFMANLDNPLRIWDHAFRHQLNEAAQHLLLTLGSLPSEVLIGDLELAFNAFYQYRRKKLGFQASSRDFENAIKELDGNFIQTSMIGRDQMVTFHNPSVDDFIGAYLDASPQDILDLIEGATFFDQFQQLWKGQRGDRFRGVDVHASTFVRRLAKRFAAPVCRVIRISNSKKEITGLTRWEISFEARMLFAVEVDQGLNTSETRSVVSQLMDQLEAQMKQCLGDRDDAVRLLKVLHSRSKAIVAQPVFSVASSFLTTDLESMEDFSCAGKFIESFPTVIREDELEKIRETFSEFCDDYDEAWVDDPEDLHSTANDLERIGKQLDVDVDEICAKLNKKATRLESEIAEENYSEDDPNEDWRERYQPTESIDSMFEGLLAEIDDRNG